MKHRWPNVFLIGNVLNIWKQRVPKDKGDPDGVLTGPVEAVGGWKLRSWEDQRQGALFDQLDLPPKILH